MLTMRLAIPWHKRIQRMLSQTAQYVLRAMVYMSEHHKEMPLMARHVAEAISVPANYLAKILQTLVHAGVLTSVRGVGGGFSFAKPIDQLRLADTLTPFEDIDHAQLCPFNRLLCKHDKYCPAHQRWEDAAKSYRVFLEETILAEFAGDQGHDE
jgi:Rrf2 family transcriptional regulator, nitric oxide-sensitive transcriptional repressor